MNKYLFPPGELSSRAVLDVGLKCTHSCKFCYYSFLDKTDNQFSGMRKVAFRPTVELKEVIKNLSEHFDHIDFTGGEPTIHPDIVELVRYCTELGLGTRMITLGQFLLSTNHKFKINDKTLLDRLLDAGLTNFLFSLHGHTEELFYEITKESLQKQLDAQQTLKDKGFQFTTNTTVIADNYQFLPKIAKLVVNSGSYLHNFILMNAYYEWNTDSRVFGKQAKFTEAQKYLNEATEILESNQIGVNVRYMPLCTTNAKNLVGVVGVRYDPYEWMNSESHNQFSITESSAQWKITKGQTQDAFLAHSLESKIKTIPIIGARQDKVFPEMCSKCQNAMECDGLDSKYVNQYGVDELTQLRLPNTKAPPMVDARAEYKPAFWVKNTQYADMRAKKIPHEYKVSVIITNYNYLDYVGKAIESVKAQTYPCEIIVVDDNSIDGSWDYIQTLDVKSVKTTGFGQPALSRNYGRKYATGDVIVFLDADDEFKPQYIAEAIEQLKKGYSLVYSDLIGTESGYVTAAEYNYGKLIYGNQLNYCTVMLAEVFDEIGGFRDNVKGCEDWDFWIAAGLRGHWGKRIPKAHLLYREKPNGLYESVVKNNIDTIFKQIQLNNKEAYPK